MVKISRCGLTVTLNRTVPSPENYVPPGARALDRRSTLSSSSCSRRRSALSRFCCRISCLCASAALSSLLSASRILSLHRRLLLYFKAVRPRSSLACRSALAPTRSCSIVSAKGWEVRQNEEPVVLTDVLGKWGWARLSVVLW